ncbi:MAG: UDP-N-acetylglucosamine pyrophosphorylase [Clostridiales bacterium]|nr:UDP-N-acetylglucosamine pyrophosphorylase [Clostridiales bacterium]
MYTTKELFDLEKTQAQAYLSQFVYPWEALQGLKTFILQLGATLDETQYQEIAPQVWAHKSAEIAPTAYLGAPCIIGEGTQIRHCAFIRGSALIGKNCVVGNSVEIKNAVLFDGAQVPHFNYVGDSILGYKAHLGAGAITSNVKSDKTLVCVKEGDTVIPTGLKKFGAMVGDFVEVGCNSVLNPGTVIGKNSRVYPLSRVRGTVQESCIYKNQGEVTPIQ